MSPQDLGSCLPPLPHVPLHSDAVRKLSYAVRSTPRALPPAGAQRTAMASLSPYKVNASGADFPDLQMSMDDTPFEDLLQSVLRGSLFEEQLPPLGAAAAAAGGEAAGGADESSGPGAARASGLRCLDSTHPPSCELCLPPPIIGEEGASPSAAARRRASTRCAGQTRTRGGGWGSARHARPSHWLLTRAPTRSAVRAGRRRWPQKRRKGAPARRRRQPTQNAACREPRQPCATTAALAPRRPQRFQPHRLFALPQTAGRQGLSRPGLRLRIPYP